jgi:hypothetical protein
VRSTNRPLPRATHRTIKRTAPSSWWPIVPPRATSGRSRPVASHSVVECVMGGNGGGVESPGPSRAVPFRPRRFGPLPFPAGFLPGDTNGPSPAPGRQDLRPEKTPPPFRRLAARSEALVGHKRPSVQIPPRGPG